MASQDFSLLLDGLVEIGALLDDQEAWKRFHLMSSNPPPVLQEHDPMDAYRLPRLRPPGSSVRELPSQSPLVVDTSQTHRYSVDLETLPADQSKSFDVAVDLATQVYQAMTSGQRPVASGGALYPLHFWAIGDLGSPGLRAMRAVDHDECVLRDAGTIAVDDLSALFIPDAGVQHAIDVGASILVIAADPTRTTYKYGNRGWRYALIETGAAMHHIMLQASSLSAPVRPIAGFFDDALRDAVTRPALPLLTIFVGAPPA
ncbi:nitroreductase family protein [Geodermatophilus sp. SYSU D01062]